MLIYWEGHGLSVCSPPAHLSLETYTASIMKDVLDCSSGNTEGFRGRVIQAPWEYV